MNKRNKRTIAAVLRQAGREDLAKVVTAQAFRQGDRVKAKGKPGIVNFVRMGGPGYSEPEAYSILLDEQVAKRGLNYSGSMFHAKDVVKASVTKTKVVTAAQWNEYASDADDHLNQAMQPLRNLEGDSSYGKQARKWVAQLKGIIGEISEATKKFGGGDTPA